MFPFCYLNCKPKYLYFIALTRTMTTKIVFGNSLSRSDPQQSPVLIIGQVKHLNLLKYQDIKVKLEPRVTEEV